MGRRSGLEVSYFGVLYAYWNPVDLWETFCEIVSFKCGWLDVLSAAAVTVSSGSAYRLV